MRIGFFTSIDDWGGSEIYLLRIMRHIRERGHVPILFGVAGTRLFTEAQQDNIESVAWKVTDRNANRGMQIMGKDKGYVSHFPEGSPLCAGFRLNRILPGALRLMLGNIREINALSQVFRMCPVDVMHVNINGYEMAGVACRFCGIPTFGRHCITPAKESSMVRRWLIYWSNKCYTITGGPSKTCVESWRLACRLDAGACRPVLNGVDLDAFRPYVAKARLTDSPFNILAVGRLHPMKGFDVLVKAFASICDSRMTLTLVGEGSCEQALKALARQLSCSGTIKFAGYQENVARLYARSHCMVLPSVSHEGCPSVLAEAMACNLPLITSDYGPLPEININCQTGLVVPAGNVTALSDAICYMANHPEDAFRMGRNGRERAAALYSKDHMIDALLAIYFELYNKRIHSSSEGVRESRANGHKITMLEGNSKLPGPITAAAILRQSSFDQTQDRAGRECSAHIGTVQREKKKYGACEQWRRWFPGSVDRATVVDRLASFYDTSAEYHAMTGSGDKTQDPHVLLLSSLLAQGGNYAEIGCGSGAVCGLVGEVGAVTGIDCSEIALTNAVKRCEGSKHRASFIKASADQLPLQDNLFDGVYSFEVMEHVWNPERMLKEMIRIVKPGGFVLLSTPNRFSLDLHLQKRSVARMFDIMCACIRRICDAVTRQPFMHVRPDLDHGVYPDCDMITAVVPVNVARLMAKLGCDIEFWDTTFMCACRPGSSTSLRFQRYAGVPFFKHFGDHLLILGRKKVEGGCQ